MTMPVRHARSKNASDVEGNGEHGESLSKWSENDNSDWYEHGDGDTARAAKSLVMRETTRRARHRHAHSDSNENKINNDDNNDICSDKRSR